MTVRKLAIRAIAPPVPAAADDGDDQVWLLNLDQIEPHTGRLLSKQMVERGSVGTSTHAFDAGNLLYSKLRPYLNKVFLPEESGFCTTELVPLRPDLSLVRRDYLAAYLRSPKFLAWVDQQVDGAKMPRVSMKVFWEHEIELPTLDEQKRIAAILDKADSLRRKRQQAIRLADDFLRAVFLDMFGDPVTNPKEWPVENLSNLCDVATGATPSRDAPSYFDGPHPWIKTGEVDSDWIVSAEERISDSAIAETNCKLFPPQTILVAMYGQGKTRGKVGMLGIPAATNQACAAILPSSKVNSEFLFSQLRMSYEALREMGRGGNQENLNLGMIKTLDILRPPTELVSKYSAIRKQLKALSKPQQEVETHSLKLAASLQAEFFG